MKVLVETPSPIYPTCVMEMNYLLYEKSDTGISWKSSSYAKDQKFVDSIRQINNWEVLTADPKSEFVVMRFSWQLEWVHKPFGMQSMIERGTTDQVNKVGEFAQEWYPARANEWQNAQKNE